jgi:protein SCO1/2
MLCSTVLQGLAAAMRQMPFDAGNQYNVLTVSFNPRETPELAAAAKSRYIKQYGRSGAEAGWHFLTGAQPEIDRLTRAVGFHYAWDPVSKQYAHATAAMVATPEGKLARYFYGVEFSPRDLRFALVEASRHKIGSPVDAVLLFCYHYDPAVGRYSLMVTRIVQLAAAVSVLIIALFILVMVRRERHQRQAGAQPVKSTL